MTMQNPQQKYEVILDNVKHGADYATKAEADAAALTLRNSNPAKNAIVREVAIPPSR